MFLPEDDQDYLTNKQIKFELKVDGEKRGVIFPELLVPGELYETVERGLIRCAATDVLVIVPKGYNSTRLDSFYTRKILKRADGQLPINTTGVEDHFGEKWQFWSRHLTDEEWLSGSRGFDSYLEYIRAAFRDA